MAKKRKLKEPKDKKINLKFPLEKTSEGAFATNTSTVNAIADDLKILTLTNHGERVINYDFGANLRPLLFEQGPDLNQKIEDAIVIAVNKWMPYVTILNITVQNGNENPTVGSNEINVTIEFTVLNESVKGQIVVPVRT